MFLKAKKFTVQEKISYINSNDKIRKCNKYLCNIKWYTHIFGLDANKNFKS